MGASRVKLLIKLCIRQWRALKKSRVQMYNAMLMMVGLVEMNSQEFRQVLPEGYFGFFLVGVGMFGWYLRNKGIEPLQLDDEVQNATVKK